MDDTKECTTCRVVKPKTEYDPDPRYRSGVRSQCRDCRYTTMERARINTGLKNRYGITIEEFEAMVLAQNGVCKICKKPETRGKRIGKFNNSPWATTRLSVDHCHKTGKVRGLLCQRCNIAIGHFGDDPEVARNAAIYLEEAYAAA